ncbi:MAG: DNA modification methylase [Chloroflexi bacterium]|nr:DNA modification methylase [Chloroflexota bacterium]
MPGPISPIVIEMVPLGELRPDPANPRRIADDELDSLTGSIREFGWASPVIVRRADGIVIGGNQRLIAAHRLGLTTVPVIKLDISPVRARLLNLALNRISGTWDDQLLARLLAELEATPDADLKVTGFGDDEIRTLLRSLDARQKQDRAENFDLDAALDEATKLRRAQLGDIWQLDEHLLLCGDATKPEDVARLLGDDRPAMAFTDPPYNVDLGHHGGHQAGRRRRTITNDALSPEAWATFIHAWAALLVAATDGAIYVAMSSREWPTVAGALAEGGGHWSDTIIWQKDRFVPGRADYQRSYEPIWYGWRQGEKHYWAGSRDQSDVWQIPRPADAPLAPVMKPLALMERAIANSSRPGDRILDVFLGSGSTLIAADRLGRRCLALELEPVLVDVALRRWERFTNRVAVLADRIATRSAGVQVQPAGAGPAPGQRASRALGGRGRGTQDGSAGR